MDENRRTRFLVSPVLFVASLLWGAWFDNPDRAWCFVTDLVHSEGEIGGGLMKVIVGLAAGGLIVFVAGYVIGTITYFFLRCFFRLWNLRWRISRTHEVHLRHAFLERIWSRFRPTLSFDLNWQRHELSAGVAFDHGILRKEYPGVHRWLFRRWNAFSIAATSFTGLLLSLLIGHCVLGLHCTWRWYVPVLAFEVPLFVSGFWAWCDTMKMLEFMSSLPRQQT